MATTLHVLKTYYSNVMRADFAHIPDPHQALLSSLSAQVDAGSLTLAAAEQSVARLAIDTTSVSSLAYNFFTGAIPYEQGFDYLVKVNGPNPNNLNSAYYQSANLENRYINFAVNLGKLGEGQEKFAAAYGSLTLSQTVTKAYTEIFGAAPDAAKVDAILNAQVPNGVGGTYTRAEYFAFYGRDGAAGVGTKAALVGWLMAEAAKADTGVYVQANNAFLADLGPDDWAGFRSDLVGRYGPQPAGTAGATIAFLPGQSVSPAASSAALQSTENNDTVTGVGLDQGQSVLTAGGNDVVTVAGSVGGLIDTGAGNDTVTVATLNPYVAILGGAETGTIKLGAGNDTLTVTDRLSYGAIVDGGAGDDTLIAAFGPFASQPVVMSNIEHLVVTGVDANFRGLNLSGAGSSFNDITSRVNGDFFLSAIAENTALRLQNVSSGAFSASYATTLVPVGPPSSGPISLVNKGPAFADLHLDNVSVAIGQSTTVTVANATTLRVHVDSDSTLSSLASGGSFMILVSGVGRLTTALGEFNSLDASQSAGVDITKFASLGGARTALLSDFNDRIALDATADVGVIGQGLVNITLGAGADTLALYQRDATFRFGNLHITGQTVDGYARVVDFVKGTDKIDLGVLTTAVAADLTQYVGTASTLEQALINVSPRLAAGGTGVFEFGGDSFIYHQDTTVGANTGDGLIRLVGVTGLTVGTGSASVDIHYG
jgi:hypothetical protein